MTRKVCVVTGTRAEYGILCPVMREIAASAELSLQIAVTGMHLMREFGYTLGEIEKDGFRVHAKVDVSYSEDTGQAAASAMGRAVSGLAKSFARLKPALVLLLGDRGEMLSAALAANYLAIPAAHIHGGELSGHVDGVLRHAITKLAHLHFPATSEAEKRILGLGEQSWRVHRVGAPALDSIRAERLPAKSELVRRYGIDASRPLAVVVQHPVTGEEAQAAAQMTRTLTALKSLGLPTLLVYPNADAGGRRMIAVINKFRRHDFLKAYRNIPHKDYLGLLRDASVLVGNSSSGIIEAPCFGLPVVNLGSRQSGRERGSGVIDAPHETPAILRAVKKTISDKKFRRRTRSAAGPYGDGRASQRIRKVLEKVRIDERLLRKRMTY